MGADFIYDIIPFAKETVERRTELTQVAYNLTEEELDIFEEEFGVKDAIDIASMFDAYWELHRMRDVGELRLPTSVNYLITGGMSYGDSPTDAFDIMRPISILSRVWNKLTAWAEEDLRRERENEILLPLFASESAGH